jgi:hypothetical protein
MNHIFLKPYSPPFPDPRQWTRLQNDQSGQSGCWMLPTNSRLAFDHTAIISKPVDGKSEINNSSLASTSINEYGHNESVEKTSCSDTEWEMELSSEWATRFANTLEKMKKRRREQSRDASIADDEIRHSRNRKSKQSGRKRRKKSAQAVPLSQPLPSNDS